MTAAEQDENVNPFPTAPVVKPDPDSRLDQLTAEYATLKPLADEYAARLKTVVDGIKNELVSLHPNQSEILLIGNSLAVPLKLEAVTQWRLASKTLKQERPELWVRYAQQSTSWRLGQLKD